MRGRGKGARPDPALIKNKVSRPADKATRRAIDEFNPLDNL